MRKYFLCLVAGLIAGGLLGIAALYVNPLTNRPADLLPADVDLSLQYTVPGNDIVALTHPNWRFLPFEPAEIGSLWEQALASTVLAVVTLHRPDGKPVALATRLSALSRQTDPLLTGLLLDDYWLVTMPGRGSLFIHSVNNLWPVVKDSVIPISVFGRKWSGPHIYFPTVGPTPGRWGRIFGGTGQYANTRGLESAQYHLNAYSRGKGLEELVGVLNLQFAPSAPGSAEDAQCQKEIGAVTKAMVCSDKH